MYESRIGRRERERERERDIESTNAVCCKLAFFRNALLGLFCSVKKVDDEEKERESMCE